MKSMSRKGKAKRRKAVMLKNKKLVKKYQRKEDIRIKMVVFMYMKNRLKKKMNKLNIKSLKQLKKKQKNLKERNMTILKKKNNQKKK